MWRQYVSPHAHPPHDAAKDKASTRPRVTVRSASEELVESAKAAGITPPEPEKPTAMARMRAMAEWKGRLTEEHRMLEYYTALRDALAAVYPDVVSATTGHGSPQALPSVGLRRMASPERQQQHFNVGTDSPRPTTMARLSPSPDWAALGPRRSSPRDRPTDMQLRDETRRAAPSVSTSTQLAPTANSFGVHENHHQHQRGPSGGEGSFVCPINGVEIPFITPEYVLDHLQRHEDERAQFEARVIPDQPKGTVTQDALSLPFHTVADEVVAIAAIKRALLTATWAASDDRGHSRDAPTDAVARLMNRIPSEAAPAKVFSRLALPCPMGCFCTDSSAIIGGLPTVLEHARSCWRATFVVDGVPHTVDVECCFTNSVGSLAERACPWLAGQQELRYAVLRQHDDAVMPLELPIVYTWALWFQVMPLS